jgi:calcium homeostasis ER protein
MSPNVNTMPPMLGTSPSTSSTSLTQSTTSSSEPPKPEIEMPYFTFPAGILINLVKVNTITRKLIHNYFLFIKFSLFQIDSDMYKPIDPKLLKLPPPQQPSERQIKAMEEFYSTPQPKARNP